MRHRAQVAHRRCAYARNPQDEDKAYAATQVLRYISDQNKLNAVRSAVYENMLVELKPAALKSASRTMARRA